MTPGMAEATAAPREVEVGGRAYTIHPLNNRDWGSLEQWMRASLINAARQSNRETRASEAEERFVLQEAYAAAQGVSIFNPSSQRLLQTLEGMTRTAWLSLRKDEPDLTLNGLADRLIGQHNALADLVAEIMDLSGFDAQEGPQEEVTEEPAKNPPAGGGPKTPARA